jgi:diaminopropionate ammonia-lyase
VTSRALVNPAVDADAVPLPDLEARPFHAALAGYAPTPVRGLPAVAAELSLDAVLVKDESDRLGLPAFKVLGASWAVERAVRERPDTHTLVAASAGNHGRAVAHVAARRGLRARIFLPARALPARRAAISREGAEVLVVDGDYEEAVARSRDEGGRPGVVEIADVGPDRHGPPGWVVDGYATLFAEAAEQAEFDLMLVPVGVGSLAAAAARAAARSGVTVVGVEPVSAACLTASLAAGVPTPVPTPGTTMAGLDCAEVSGAVWPDLQAGIRGTLTVSDDEAAAAMREFDGHGLGVGECAAATLAALRVLADEAETAALRTAVALGPATRVLLVATEGRTGEAGANRHSATGPA